MKLIVLLLGVLTVIAVGIIMVIDVASTPTAADAQCLLARRILLPGVCVNNCSPALDCTHTHKASIFALLYAGSILHGAILNRLRMKLRDHNGFEKDSLHKTFERCNLSN